MINPVEKWLQLQMLARLHREFQDFAFIETGEFASPLTERITFTSCVFSVGHNKDTSFLVHHKTGMMFTWDDCFRCDLQCNQATSLLRLRKIEKDCVKALIDNFRRI